MADSIFQSDLKIKIPVDAGEKATLSINERGDLNLISGREKLSAQLIRAIVNDSGIGNKLLNTSVSTRAVQIMVNLVLRTFRQNQLNVVNKGDPNFSGFSIYRLKAGTTSTYLKISPNFTTWKFTDSSLTNGIEYKYALTKTYNGVFETGFTEKIAVTPQASTSKQEIIIGEEVAAIPGDRSIDFYVVYPQRYKGSELIENILSMDVAQDTAEPRRYTVNVVVQDLRGDQVPIAAVRRNPST